MKANEYIKNYGIDSANKILRNNQNLMNIGFFINLKRIVESYKLVESCGGLDKAKEKIEVDAVWCNGGSIFLNTLKQAISDVESCQ